MQDAVLPHRVAVYFAPAPESPWWQAGSRWLGRCAATAAALPQTAIEGIEAELFARLTAAPRRYGWHATLKAPFRLAPRHGDLACVRTVLQGICSRQRAFELPLHLACMGDFLALRPLQTPPELERLEADCVQSLQPLAAQLGASELARRRHAGLSVEQEALLQAWGYPWVLQEFRFHFSLTGPLDGLAPVQREALLAGAARQFHGLPPCRVDRLSLFVEPVAGADFELLQQVRLGS